MKLSIAELAEDCFPEDVMIGNKDAELTARVKARVLAKIEAENSAADMREKRLSVRPRKIVTLGLAAALMLSFGLAAYAIGSIHAARQQELRAELNISESHAESYVEYELPEENAPGLVLLSAIQDGSFQKVYVDVSPVTREQLDRYTEPLLFMWQLEGFRVDGQEAFGMASPCLREGRVVHEHGETVAAILEDAYDAENQTLTLRIEIPLSQIREVQRQTGSERVGLTVWLWDPQAQAEAGEESLGDWLHSQPSFGRVSFRPTDREMAVFDLGGFRYRDPETGRELELVALELSPTAAVWRLRYAGMEESFAAQDQEELSAWAHAEDRMIRETRIVFADGSSLTLPGAVAAPLEDGTVNCGIGWERAVDIHNVQQITLDGQVLWQAP